MPTLWPPCTASRGAPRSRFSTHYWHVVVSALSALCHMLLQFIAPHAVRCRRRVHTCRFAAPPARRMQLAPQAPAPFQPCAALLSVPFPSRRAIVIGLSRRSDPQHQRRGGRVHQVPSCRLSPAATPCTCDIPVPYLTCDELLTPVCQRLHAACQRRRSGFLRDTQHVAVKTLCANMRAALSPLLFRHGGECAQKGLDRTTFTFY